MRELEQALEQSQEQAQDDRGVAEPTQDVAVPRADRPSTPEPPASAVWIGEDRAAVTEAVARAGAAAAALSAALCDAAAGLSTPPRTSGAPSPVERTDTSEPDAAPSSTPMSRPPRRVPVRLRSGVHDGTPEALRQLLGSAGTVAIIDGYNVTMEGWPGLDHGGQRSSLLSALAGLQALVPATIHVVFDGDADGRRPSVGAPLPVRVHFSDADTEADDVILSMVARLPTDTPVVVVSSDRRVADGARRLGANALRSSVLLEQLRG